LYRKVPSAEQAAAFSMTIEEMTDTVEVWPDTLQAVQCFQALGSQWRHGFAGIVGLDYGVVPVVFRMMDVPRKEWRQLFDDIRIMEQAAISEIHGV